MVLTTSSGAALSLSYVKWFDDTDFLHIFLAKGKIQLICHGVGPEGFSTGCRNLESVLREYVALSSALANEYGLPTEEVFETSAGYEDAIEAAWENKRLNAKRSFEALDGKVTVKLRETDIYICYELNGD